MSVNKKDKILGLRLQYLGGVLLILMVFFYQKALKTNSLNYESEKYTIEQLEQANPLDFLSVEYKYNENITGRKYKITGSVANKALVSHYKDVVLEIDFYSQTKTKIGSEKHTIYEVFPPSSTKPFRFTLDKYKNVNSIAIKISGALQN